MFYLRLSSLLLLFCLLGFRYSQEQTLPNLGFENDRYRASVDVMNKHLSGILFIKREYDSMPVSKPFYKVVFVNEMGATYFDYTFYSNQYVVNSIQDKMNKKAVKETLAKDFGMLLCSSIFKDGVKSFNDSSVIYQLKKKGEVQYSFSNNKVNRIENYGKKSVVSIFPFYKSNNPSPDSISIQHHNFNFAIQLKKMYAE